MKIASCLAALVLVACSGSGSDTGGQSLGNGAGNRDAAADTDATASDDPRPDGAAPDDGSATDDDAGSPADAGSQDDAGDASPPVSPSFALDFGSGSPSLFVQVNDVARLKAAGSFTLEAWLRLGRPPATGLGCVFCVPHGSGNGDTLALWFNGGNLYWGVNLLDGQNGEAVFRWTLPSDTWHHVAAIYDDTARKSTLYVDGALAVSADKRIDGLTYDDHPLLIGADLSSEAITFGFSGWIDEVRLYDRVRTEAEIRADMRGVSPLGDDTLFGYYPFDEGRGSTATDFSSTHATGYLGSPETAVGGPTWVASEVVFSP